MMLGLDASSISLATGIVFAAAVIRGYAGFGFSAFVVASLSLFWSPASVVPLVLMLEILGGLHLLPSVWREVDWRQLGWILAGTLVATPLGIELLGRLSVDTMRMVISLIVLLAASWIASGRQLAAGQRTPVVLAGGLASGLANGAAGLGGLPLVALFLSNRTSAQALRGTLAVYFVVSDSYAIGVAGARGLVTREVLELLAVSVVPLAAGVWLGNRGYARSQGRNFRRYATALLITLAAIGLLRALLS